MRHGGTNSKAEEERNATGNGCAAQRQCGKQANEASSPQNKNGPDPGTRAAEIDRASMQDSVHHTNKHQTHTKPETGSADRLLQPTRVLALLVW